MNFKVLLEGGIYFLVLDRDNVIIFFYILCGLCILYVVKLYFSVF